MSSAPAPLPLPSFSSDCILLRRGDPDFTDANARFVGPDGCFSNVDCRWLWGSHGDTDMNEVWRAYMEPNVYERVLAAKRRWDPDHVFSANTLCVGWSHERASALEEPCSPAVAAQRDGIDLARLDREMTGRWLDARQHAARRRAERRRIEEG